MRPNSREVSISFLVCTRNRGEVVRDCVVHLLNSARDDIEVIVRDNCSTDDTVTLLRAIEDRRLSIHVAPENQGTASFFEITKLANGEIVTWLSDEDDFQFDVLDPVLARFKEDTDCLVIVGGIVVGTMARRVMFPDETITNPVDSHVKALSFSGCGGVFVRRSALEPLRSVEVHTPDEGYALWNYYPVGFFAGRCIERSLTTISSVVVVQSRFARTTHNWSKLASGENTRVPHYYPESVCDRLATHLVSVCSKRLPLMVKLSLARQLIRLFVLHSASYCNPDFYELLYENYPDETVRSYIHHVRKLRLDRPVGRWLWSYSRVFLMPARFLRTLRQWRQLCVT